MNTMKVLFGTTLTLTGLCASTNARATVCPVVADQCNGTNSDGISGSVVISGVNDAIGNGVLGQGGNPGMGVVGIAGSTAPSYGVYGEALGGGVMVGVFGVASSASGYGVEGSQSGAGVAVYGSGGAIGVSGKSTVSGGTGVLGTSTSGNGLNGVTSSTSAAAVSGTAPSGGISFYGDGDLILNVGLGFQTGGGSWQVWSDERIKKDVKDFHLGLAELRRLRPVSFKYNGLGSTDDNGKEYVGVIAQELEKILPAMVAAKKRKLHKDDVEDTDIKYVDPNEFTYLLINSVQEQQMLIEQQDARIAKLERGRSLVSSVLPTGLGGMALGLVPLGLLVVNRKRKDEAV
jgi:endosialidase-like protein